jgi:hypothetical protein
MALPVLTAGQVAEFWERGFLLVPDLITAADVAVLIGALEQLEAAHHAAPPPGLAFSAARPRQLVMTDGQFNPALIPGPLSRLVQYRPLLEGAQQLVGGPLKLTGAGYLDGGRPDGGHYWHQDTGIVTAPPPGVAPDPAAMPAVSTTGLESPWTRYSHLLTPPCIFH